MSKFENRFHRSNGIEVKNHFEVVARSTIIIMMFGLHGCALLPTSGPARNTLVEAGNARNAGADIQVIDLDAPVIRQLKQHRRTMLFSESFGMDPIFQLAIGAGDSLEVSIWEAPPATLFGGGIVDSRNPSTVRATVLPEQVVTREGVISVPFAGRIVALGRSTHEVEADIRRSLMGKANQPEVAVRVARNASATATVVGEVANSVRLPLTPVGERVLDALAAAGGVRQPIGKITVQLSRGGRQRALPMESIIRDPAQNIPLIPGDVITALFQPLSFTALGATGKSQEVMFETQGISLAQALARVGGLDDSRSDAQGVFVFRLESNFSLPWTANSHTSVDAQIPVVYRLDLKNPASFFAMQGFEMRDKDVLFVSNAPAAELQKFLNLIFSITYPVLTTIQVTR